ncbi:MAG: hypothetical protein AAGF95_18875 [Chloroflexota bacterium]
MLALAIILSVVSVYPADDSPALILWVVGAGGNTSIGGDYTLNSTSGHLAVGVSTGGPYTLNVVFWQPNTDSGSIHTP